MIAHPACSQPLLSPMGNTASVVSTLPAGETVYTALVQEPSPPNPALSPLVRLFGQPRRAVSGTSVQQRADAATRAVAATDFVRLHGVIEQLTEAIDNTRIKAARCRRDAHAARKHEGAPAAAPHKQFEKQLIAQSTRYQQIRMALEVAVGALESQALTGTSVLTLAACTRDLATMLGQTSPADAQNVRDQLDQLLAQADEAATALATDPLGTGLLAPTLWYERDSPLLEEEDDDDDDVATSSISEELVRARAPAATKPAAVSVSDADDDEARMESVSLI